ncbi:hypothetical protein Tco_1518674, partial [Tanacetum coccineum]
MVNTDSPKVRKDHKSNESSNPSVEPTKEAQVSHISDAKVGPLTFKRPRLMKNGCFVFKNVVEKIHSDDEKTLSNTHMLTDGILEDEKSVSDDESLIIFCHSTKNSMSSISKCQKYSVIDDSTDEEFVTNI